MSAQGEYYDVQQFGDEWVAMYDQQQQLRGPSFATEAEAQAFVDADWVHPIKKDRATNKYLLQLDGDMWMVADISFVNLQESDCAFGKTPNEALSLFQDEELGRLKAEYAKLAVGVSSKEGQP